MDGEVMNWIVLVKGNWKFWEKDLRSIRDIYFSKLLAAAKKGSSKLRVRIRGCLTMELYVACGKSVLASNIRVEVDVLDDSGRP